MAVKEIFKGEIASELMESIIEALPRVPAIYESDHVVLIHGQGGQTKAFYRSLKEFDEIELLWTGWSSNVWWTYLLSFIPGQGGLIKVNKREALDAFYLETGAQAMCGLYFIPENRVISVLQDVKKNRGENIETLLSNEQNYFLLTIDFDYHGGPLDGEIYYRELILGAELNSELKKALTRI